MSLLRFLVWLPLRLVVRAALIALLALVTLVAHEFLPREQQVLLRVAVVAPLAELVAAQVAAFTAADPDAPLAAAAERCRRVGELDAPVAGDSPAPPAGACREAADPSWRQYVISRERLRALLGPSPEDR